MRTATQLCKDSGQSMTIKNSAGNPRLTTIYLATFKVINSAGKNDLRMVLTVKTVSASPCSHEPNLGTWQLACFYNGRSSFMHFPPSDQQSQWGSQNYLMTM